MTSGWISKPWYDRNIRAGQEWDPEIMAKLKQSDLILLMVTDNFMGSEYCMKEVDMALERHQTGSARVVPVIVEKANWQIGRFSKLQAVPKTGNPIFRGNYLDKDLRVEVSQGILEEITAFCSNGSGTAPRSSNALDPSQTVLAQLCNRGDQDRQLRDAWQQHFQSFQLRRRPQASRHPCLFLRTSFPAILRSMCCINTTKGTRRSSRSIAPTFLESNGR